MKTIEIEITRQEMVNAACPPPDVDRLQHIAMQKGLVTKGIVVRKPVGDVYIEHRADTGNIFIRQTISEEDEQS